MTMTRNKKIAYCGLYRGNCVIRNGQIGSLSRKMFEHMDSPEFRKLADGLPDVMPDTFSGLKNDSSFLQTLKAMTNLDGQKICKDGGGSTACKIRRCCLMKRYDGCWEWADFSDCDTLAWLNPVHGGANIKNINRICMIGMEKFLKGPKDW